jgi:hypothetical protein
VDKLPIQRGHLLFRTLAASCGRSREGDGLPNPGSPESGLVIPSDPKAPPLGIIPSLKIHAHHEKEGLN